MVQENVTTLPSGFFDSMDRLMISRCFLRRAIKSVQKKSAFDWEIWFPINRKSKTQKPNVGSEQILWRCRYCNLWLVSSAGSTQIFVIRCAVQKTVEQLYHPYRAFAFKYSQYITHLFCSIFFIKAPQLQVQCHKLLHLTSTHYTFKKYQLFYHDQGHLLRKDQTKLSNFFCPSIGSFFS